MKWAAENNANICFGERVLEVDFDGGAFVVQTTKRRVLGDNVVVGVGIVPDVPDFARACLNDSTHFHVNEFAAKAGVTAGKRVLVIGGGQSGAEVVLEMLRRGGGQAPAALSWLSRRENYFPLDDSPSPTICTRPRTPTILRAGRGLPPRIHQAQSAQQRRHFRVHPAQHLPADLFAALHRARPDRNQPAALPRSARHHSGRRALVHRRQPSGRQQARDTGSRRGDLGQRFQAGADALPAAAAGASGAGGRGNRRRPRLRGAGQTAAQSQPVHPERHPPAARPGRSQSQPDRVAQPDRDPAHAGCAARRSSGRRLRVLGAAGGARARPAASRGGNGHDRAPHRHHRRRHPGLHRGGTAAGMRAACAAQPGEWA